MQATKHITWRVYSCVDVRLHNRVVRFRTNRPSVDSLPWKVFNRVLENFDDRQTAERRVDPVSLLSPSREKMQKQRALQKIVRRETELSFPRQQRTTSDLTLIILFSVHNAHVYLLLPYCSYYDLCHLKRVSVSFIFEQKCLTVQTRTTDPFVLDLSVWRICSCRIGGRKVASVSYGKVKSKYVRAVGRPQDERKRVVRQTNHYELTDFEKRISDARSWTGRRAPCSTIN